MIVTDLERLAELAALEAEAHQPRTPGRRAAAHLYISLTIPPAKSITSARSAIATFGDERTQADALALLTLLTDLTATQGSAQR